MGPTESKKKEWVSWFLDRGVLVSPEFMDSLPEGFAPGDFFGSVSGVVNAEEMLLLVPELERLLPGGQGLGVNWEEFDRSRALFEKGKDKETFSRFVEFLGAKRPEPTTLVEEVGSSLSVLASYPEESKKREVADFTDYFNSRYAFIESLLRNRPELQKVASIGRMARMKQDGPASIIGMVGDIKVTKNGNRIIQIEDPTGSIKVIATKSKPEAFAAAKELTPDEVVGLSGALMNGVLFVNSVIWPDVPLNRQMKRSSTEAYAIFLSDLHVGSKNFLAEEFGRFLSWLRGETGNQAQREIAQKTKYIFIVGDLVDGIGIYPSQKQELVIHDIREQYRECARYLRQIPKHIKIIVCPGNHDAVRIAEPQPPMDSGFAKPLLEMPNLTLLSNPSYVNIHQEPGFEGFTVLLYHGYSFDYYISNIESIRTQGGYDRADLMMKYLLKRRHLAPTHTSTLYVPTNQRDPLLIDRIPDFFVTGHIHKTSVSNYKNITLVSGSCWQSKTSFQEKVGHHPEPCRVPVVNLKDRQVRILKFGK